MATPARSAWKRKRPAPSNATGWGKSVTDDVVWTRILEPRESYQIEYIDSQGEVSERTIELLKLGSIKDVDYLFVMHLRKPKTLRADRIRSFQQLTEGHAPSIERFPQYADRLPAFPIEGAVYKMPTVAASRRTWTADLNAYTCTCPEKRIRLAMNYEPGQLGHVCPHIARAILEHLPATAAWPPNLLKFLADPRRVHIDNLS